MADKKRVGVFFDGTGNHNENDKAIDHSNSNVGRLYDQYNGDDRFYEKGVGTVDLNKEQIKKIHDAKGRDSFTMPWEDGDDRSDYYSETDQAFGFGMDERVNKNLKKVKNFIKNNPDSELTIDVFGFSRGAAEARFFINKVNAYINEKNLQDKVKVGFVGIYDTVEADNLYNGRQGNINFSKDSAEKIVHFTAKDERRDTFDLTTLKDKDGKLASNMEEIEMLGVHSDVGGGYEFTKKGDGEDCDADKEQCYRAEPSFTKCLTASYLGGNKAILQRSLELDSFAKQHHYNILKKTSTFYMNSQTPILPYTEVCATMEHRVYDGLNNVYLNLMADKAREAGVPLKDFSINNSDYTYGVHDEKLKKYYKLKKENKPISKGLEEKVKKLEELERYIEGKYVNDSTIGFTNYDLDSSYDVDKRLFPNKEDKKSLYDKAVDRDGQARDIRYNEPNKAVIPNKIKEQKHNVPIQKKRIINKKNRKKDEFPIINLKLNNDIMVDNPESLDIERKIAKSKQLNRIVSNIANGFNRRGFKNATFSSNISTNNVLSLSFIKLDENQKVIFSSSIKYKGEIKEEDVYKWANEEMNKIASLEKKEFKLDIDLKDMSEYQDIFKEDENKGKAFDGSLDNVTQPNSNNILYKLNPNRLSQNIKNKRFLKQSISSNMININLENKSQKLFKKLGLRHKKIPTLNHNQNLPEKIEGMYRKGELSLKKNPRVSDKKAEAVAMHEIYHHTQKDKGLELEQEESIANMIEKAYLNENQQTSQEIDFDLIYAYTIKQFYEHEELEQLVYSFGGDVSVVRRLYSHAMEVISEFQVKEANNIDYVDSQVKKVVGDSGVRYKESDVKASFADGFTNFVGNIEDFFSSNEKKSNNDYLEQYYDNVAGVRG